MQGKIWFSDMSDKIRHPGVVCSVGEGGVEVRIVQFSACGACKVASRCNASESKEKRLKVEVVDSSSYAVGDGVEVEADLAVGLRAVFYAYLLPLLLMVAILVAAVLVTGSEGVAALSAIGILVPYYLLLWLMSGRMKRSLSFRIVGRIAESK